MSKNHSQIHINDHILAEIKAGTDLRKYAMAQGLSPLPKRADRFACPWRSGADSDGFQIFSDGWKDYVTGESGDAVEFVRRLYGCDFAEALGELARYAGIELPAYQPEANSPEEKEPDAAEIMKNAKIRPDVKAVYKYCDAGNRLVFEVLRLEPGRKGKGKEFRQRRPDGKGGWIYNLKGIDEKPLYRLPEWLKSDDESLFLVEGEKDVDNLFALGLKATCNSCGAGKWQDNYAEQLADKNLVIIPDNDDAGRRHTEKIIPEILRTAASVRVLELSGLPPKGDVSDWIAAMRNDSRTDDAIREKLLKLAKTCPELPKDSVPEKAEPLPKKQAAIEPEDEAPMEISEASFPITKAQARKMRVMPKDIADAFMCEHNIDGMPLYRIFRGVWYCYKDGIYVQLSRGDLYSDVMTFLRQRFPDYANISSRNNVIANFEASEMSGIPSKTKFPCWLPEHTPAGEWFGMGNCILNVELAAAWLTGKAIDPGEFIKEPTPKLFSTFKVNYNYDPNAKCPKFMKFIEEVQPDPAGRDVVAMMFGLMLVTDCRYEVMFILFGRAGTGKSTALDILREVVGEQNTCCLTLDKLSEKHSIHLVTEHSVNIVGDASYEAFATRALDEGLLKSMISGGEVPVEHKHKDPDNAPTIARFLIATNTLPPFADRTDGVWDRVRIIPFNQRFRNTSKHNPNLKYEIIKDELPGVFNWALKGLAMLRKLGHFPEHPEGLKLVEEHRLNCDHERQFLEDNYAEHNGSYVLKAEVYDAYRRFCGENGFRPKNAANFGLQVKRIFPEVINERVRLEATQPRIWRNIARVYL
jgi:putative DNA primase/helicase